MSSSLSHNPLPVKDIVRPSFQGMLQLQKSFVELSEICLHGKGVPNISTKVSERIQILPDSE